MSRDAPYLRVTTEALTLKADSNDLPEQKHPPRGVHKTLPFAREMESSDFFPCLLDKEPGKEKTYASSSLPPRAAERGQSAAAG